MNNKYLFFDYDGTLAEKDKPVSQIVIDALNKAKRAGHKIFICSGRCRYMLPEIKGVDFDGYILACGADVRVGNDILIDWTVKMSSLKRIADETRNQGVILVLEGENAAICIPEYSDSWKTSFSAPSFTDCIEQFGNTAIINKFSIMTVCDEKIKNVADTLGFYFIDHFHSGEFVPKGYSKHGGIKAVLDFFGADVSDSIAFGDSMNDYDMLKFAGIGVAMANSTKTVKSVADFVTKDVALNGVAHYINNILLKQEELI